MRAILQNQTNGGSNSFGDFSEEKLYGLIYTFNAHLNTSAKSWLHRTIW